MPSSVNAPVLIKYKQDFAIRTYMNPDGYNNICNWRLFCINHKLCMDCLLVNDLHVPQSNTGICKLCQLTQPHAWPPSSSCHRPRFYLIALLFAAVLCLQVRAYHKVFIIKHFWVHIVLKTACNYYWSNFTSTMWHWSLASFTSIA